MKLVKPNYSQRTPVFDDGAFTDNRGPKTTLNTVTGPKIGSPTTSFNPGQGAGPLPSGPPRYVSPAGRRPPVAQKAATNKRIGS